MERICSFCGARFQRRQGSVRETCSSGCAHALGMRNSKPPTMIACAECGKEFPRRTQGRYCSKECYATAARRRAQAARDERASHEVSCAWCGTTFTTRSEHRKFCSKRCRYTHKRVTRKAIKRGVFRHEVGLAYVLEKDAGVCQLCGEPVADTRVPDPLAPTIDHIVPLARGGLHERGNVQLAHFICNSRKGAREVA